MVRFDDPATERRLAELLALGDRPMLRVWTTVGYHLCMHATEEFQFVFAKLLQAVPIARPAERMPNLANWRWAGAALIASTVHDRILLCMTILEAHEVLADRCVSP